MVVVLVIIVVVRIMNMNKLHKPNIVLFRFMGEIMNYQMGDFE